MNGGMCCRNLDTKGDRGVTSQLYTQERNILNADGHLSGGIDAN